MFKKILIPADGSPVSAAAGHAGIALARQLGAEVLGLYVAPKYQYPVYVEIIPPSYPSEEEYESLMRNTGNAYLNPMREEAASAGLKFEAITGFSDSVPQEIIRMAEKNACDLVYMGSHGKGGLGQLLLGSVTTKVLAASPIPVLVHKEEHRPEKSPGSRVK